MRKANNLDELVDVESSLTDYNGTDVLTPASLAPGRAPYPHRPRSGCPLSLHTSYPQARREQLFGEL